MSISAIAGYAHAFGLGGHGFGNPISTQSPSQQSTSPSAFGPSIGTTLQQTQNPAPSSADDGNDSEEAFLNALKQMTLQANPSLQGMVNSAPTGSAKSTTSAGTTSTGTTSWGTTANGSGGAATGSTNGSTTTDAPSSTTAQSVQPHRHHRHGGSQIDNSDGGQPGESAPTLGSGSALGSFFNPAQTSPSLTLSGSIIGDGPANGSSPQTSPNLTLSGSTIGDGPANGSAGQTLPSLTLSGSIIGDGPASGSTGQTLPSLTLSGSIIGDGPAGGSAGQTLPSLTLSGSIIGDGPANGLPPHSGQLSQPSGLGFISSSQPGIAIGTLGTLTNNSQMTSVGTSSSTATGSTIGPSAFPTLPGTPNTASELASMLQTSSTTSASAAFGGGVGAWAQSMEQSLMGTISALI